MNWKEKSQPEPYKQPVQEKTCYQQIPKERSMSCAGQNSRDCDSIFQKKKNT